MTWFCRARVWPQPSSDGSVPGCHAPCIVKPALSTSLVRSASGLLWGDDPMVAFWLGEVYILSVGC